MALSEYDKAQFESLTADFQVEDVAALKKMEKRAKASEMSFMTFPLHLVTTVAMIVALLFAFGGAVTGNHSQMSASAAIVLLIFGASLMLPAQHPVVKTEGKDEN